MMIKQLYSLVTRKVDKYLFFITISAFILGLVAAAIFSSFGNIVNSLIESFIDGYGYVAPFVIFIILTPALVRIFKSDGKFGFYAIKWFAVRKVLASIWAVIFTVIIFKFSIFPNHSSSLTAALSKTLSSFLWMAVHSPYFWAMYASIAVALVSVKTGALQCFLDKAANNIEHVGGLLEPLIPLLMFTIGAYIYSLPRHLQGLNSGITLNTINIFGFSLNPNTSIGMILIYVAGALLVAIACFLWHFTLILLSKYKVQGFSIKSYFKDYWIRVYPLLWATSSEALATPLNLYLVKKYAPQVKTVVRRFIIGVGSYMNINGTLICVFVLAGLVGKVLGLDFSLFELLLAIPIVFIISYGVPGIPGELVLFAGPLSIMLNIPVQILPVFLALYIGLQIGLPDSFRTGNNSTDDYLCCVYLNNTYLKRFFKGDKK